MGGGNPLLIEQLVRIFFEQRVIEPQRRRRVPRRPRAPRRTSRCPMSVEDAVRARLAALTPPERELLEGRR